MKRMAWLWLLLVLPLAALAVENGQVMYAGGTVATFKEGTLGNMVTTSPTVLTFESAGNQLTIPFANIESYEFSEQLARHLGVLPAIGAGLVRHRQKRHFLRISYKAENDAEQVVIFEVPKQMPRVLLAILQARAPDGCKVNAPSKCVLSN
ncbi:MAG TPA: hypothetical protein VIX11_11650 [Candidatus Acidoferrum sp.]